MTNSNTKPEAAPAAAHIDPAVAPATDTTTKVAPPSGEHKGTNVEPAKS